MSIKTNKRLALGVIAALVFAPFAAIAPANAVAAPTTPFGVTASSFAPADSFAATVAVQQLAGANNFVDLTSGDAGDVTKSHVAKVTGGTFTSVTNGATVSAGALNAAKTEIVYPVDAQGLFVDANDRTTFRVATPTAGTITVVIATRVTANSGVVTDTTLQTFTITVLATAVTNVYSAAESTVFAIKGAGTPVDLANANSADTTSDAAAISVPASIPATSAGTVEALGIKVDQEDANGVDLTTAVKNEISISPIGAVGIAVNTPLGSYATATGQNSSFFVFADGRAGVATVTVTVGGVVAKTYKVNFFGAVASIVATSKKSSINADAGAAVTGVFEVLASDAAGTPVPDAAIAFGAAADATLVTTAAGAASTDAAGKSLVQVTPVAGKYGTTTVTVKVGTVFSNAITVVFAHNQIATASLAFGKTTYLPGEKATLTLAAKDKNGLIVPDGLDAAGHMVTATTLSTTSTLGTGTQAWVAGSYAQDLFAPVNTTITNWTVTVKMDTDAVFAAAVQGATLTATATVGIPPAPVVVPPVVYDNPTLSFVKDSGRVILSGTAVDGEGDIIIYTKKVGTTAWKERAKTLEVAAPGDFNGSIKAPKSNVLIRVKQEGTGQFSNQIIVLK